MPPANGPWKSKGGGGKWEKRDISAKTGSSPTKKKSGAGGPAWTTTKAYASPAKRSSATGSRKSDRRSLSSSAHSNSPKKSSVMLHALDGTGIGGVVPQVPVQEIGPPNPLDTNAAEVTPAIGASPAHGGESGGSTQAGSAASNRPSFPGLPDSDALSKARASTGRESPADPFAGSLDQVHRLNQNHFGKKALGSSGSHRRESAADGLIGSMTAITTIAIFSIP
eukprot:gene24043-31491_t